MAIAIFVITMLIIDMIIIVMIADMLSINALTRLVQRYCDHINGALDTLLDTIHLASMNDIYVTYADGERDDDRDRDDNTDDVHDNNNDS